MGRATGIVLLVILALAATSYLFDYVAEQQTFAEVELSGDISNVQHEQLNIYSRLNEHLFTLATLVIAASGALLGITTGGDSKITKDQSIMVMISCIFAGLSMFLGYKSYHSTVWMLSNNFFNLDNVIVSLPRRLQFYSFFGAVAFLVAAIILLYFDRRPQ